MKFYAYIPTASGHCPMGTENRILFELKTIRGAIKRCNRTLGNVWVLFRYTNFYDNKTFSFVHSKGMTPAQWEGYNQDMDLVG